MNTRSTFDVLFYVKRGEPLKDGSLPVMCRITVNGTKSGFSCKMSVPAELWEGGKAVGRSDTAKKTNRELGRIEESVRSHYKKIVERDSHVTAEKVKNAHLGLSMQHETLLAVYDLFIVDFGKMDVPKRILEKYDGLGTDGHIFPVPNYPTLKYHIKIIARLCGIEKNVTWHLARHSYLSFRLKASELQAQNFRQATIWKRANLNLSLRFAQIHKEQLLHHKCKQISRNCKIAGPYF